MDARADGCFDDQSNGPLYERLGGKIGLYAVVDRLYDRVTADSKLLPYFADADLTRLRLHQAAFLAMALGGPIYDAPPMEEAHKGLAVTGEHFDLMVDHLASVLLDFGVSDDDIQTVLERVYALKAAIIRK